MQDKADSRTYVVKQAKTPKRLPIDPSSDDPFYRYQVHQLNVQVVGRGKMIRTYFLNGDEVADDLHVPAECTLSRVVLFAVRALVARRYGHATTRRASHIAARAQICQTFSRKTLARKRRLIRRSRNANAPRSRASIRSNNSLTCWRSLCASLSCVATGK